jgi:glycosyltransferase involved in cell wall biosynthesis
MMLTVNGRFQNQRTTGVQRYAREITSRLRQQVEVVAPRGWTSGVRGHIWEQTVLPQLTQGALLWSPCNTGPLSVKQQVVTIHDCAFADHPEAFSRPFAAWYQWLIPRLARRARRVITVSRFSAIRLAELYRIDIGKIAVIYNGVDARFRPAPADQIAALRQRLKLPERYVLSVGSIEPRKNLRRLLAAWERMKPATMNVGLVLAGGGMPIFRHASIDRLPQGVQLVGYVDDADLPTLYSGATAFMYPSLYEGFGLTVLEAMACGTPVICSQTTSLPEVAGDAALQVDPLDVDQIASVTAQLVSDDALCCQLRERGLQRAAQFTWEASATATANELQAASLN